MFTSTALSVCLAATALAQTGTGAAAPAKPAPGSASARSAPTELIPRSVLFGNPERGGVQLSPDGKFLAYLAPLDGVMNVYVQAVGGGDAKAVTRSKDRPISQYFWAINGEQILYMQDRGGDENFLLYGVDIASGEEKELTPFPGSRVAGVQGHDEKPDEVLVQLNNRDPSVFDVHRLNTKTGEMELVFENTMEAAGFIIDHSWVVRGSVKMESDGGSTVSFRDSGQGEWYELMRIPMEDAMTTQPAGMTRDGKTLYALDSTGRDTAALISVTPGPGGGTNRKVIHESAKADVGDTLTHPKTGVVQAVAVEYLRNEWTIIDKTIAPDFDALRKLDEGELQIISRTLDDTKWIAAYLDDDHPIKYWLWDRTAKKGTYLFTNRPALEKYQLAEMKPVEIKARDGMTLPSYLTLPLGHGGKPSPMVLFVHGGPWGRDSWGYNPYHQWLANRGYAVLSVNFRASTGFGKKFINAGNKQWNAAMQDDLVDAVNWAVAQGHADRSKIAIMGGSYGGYATLAGLTRDPELFACGVDIVGPSHIKTLLESVPPYWKPLISMFETRVGSLSDPSYLDSISPLTQVENIKRPLLIGQGANDPRVKIRESDQIVAAMQERSIPVTYVVFPDEGHGFRKPTNNMAFNAVTETFLARHLGGRSEAIAQDVAGSTAQVRSIGDLDLPGVTEWKADPAAEAAAAAAAQSAASGPEIKLEELSELERKQAEQALAQMDKMPPEMVPMIISQLEAQAPQVPEGSKKLFMFMLQELKKKAAAPAKP